MVRYFVRRVSLALATVLAAVLITFALVHLTPGSPGELILGAGAAPAQVAEKNAETGWSDPVLHQLGGYLAGLARGDLGVSIIDGRSIGQDLAARLPVTGLIAVLATLLSGLLGVGLGTWSAVRGGRVAALVAGSSGIALSLPPFWVGVVLVYLVAIQGGILPATGYVSPTEDLVGWLRSITLPVLCLAVSSSAIVARTAHVAMRRALLQPHVQMVRSLGASRRRILLVVALRDASVPIISVLGIQFIALFGGTLIVEQFFGLPGLGQAASIAITSHDFPAVEGVVVIAAVVVVTVNLVLDLLVAWLDPRVVAA